MEAVHARLRAAAELRQLTIALHREQLRRRHPERSLAWIEARLAEWVLHAEPPSGRPSGAGLGR